MHAAQPDCVNNASHQASGGTLPRGHFLRWAGTYYSTSVELHGCQSVSRVGPSLCSQDLSGTCQSDLMFVMIVE